jgi:hypothetical protein
VQAAASAERNARTRKNTSGTRRTLCGFNAAATPNSTPEIIGRLFRSEIAQIAAELAKSVVCPRINTKIGCGNTRDNGTAHPEVTRRTALQNAARLSVIHDQ